MWAMTGEDSPFTQPSALAPSWMTCCSCFSVCSMGVGSFGSGFCEAAYQTPPPMRAIASSPPSPAITAFFLSNSWPKSTMVPFFPVSSSSIGTCGICFVPISCLSLSKSFLSSMTNLPFNPAPRARRLLQSEPICMCPRHPHRAKSRASSSLRVTRTSARRCGPR